MNDILTDLYYGEISPWERRPIRSAENLALNQKIEEEKQYFTKEMSPDDRTRFDMLETFYTQSSDMEQADAFSYGFKLGTELMMTLFTEYR